MAVSLALQRLGLPIKFIIGMLDFIQRMVHNLCTGLRNSALTYGGSDIPETYKHHLQGLNQGNGAGPTIWSIFSPTIFKILRDNGYGTLFISSLTKATLRRIGFLYMDDCDLFNSLNTLKIRAHSTW